MAIDNKASPKQVMEFIDAMSNDINKLHKDRIAEIIEFGHDKSLEKVIKLKYNISQDSNYIFGQAMKLGNFEAIKILMDIKSVYSDDDTIIFSLQTAFGIMESYKKLSKETKKIILYVLSKNEKAREKFSKSSMYGGLSKMAKQVLKEVNSKKKLGKYADLLDV